MAVSDMSPLTFSMWGLGTACRGGLTADSHGKSPGPPVSCAAPGRTPSYAAWATRRSTPERLSALGGR
jgi:hypothetical protein